MWRLKKKTDAESFQYGEMTIRLYVDRDVDAARVVVSDEPVAHTDRVEGMGNVDFDAEGNVVAIELFHFSEQVEAWRQKQDAKHKGPADKDLADDLRAFASRSVDRATELSRSR
jgi:uncharacterized protein YuzE